MEVPGPSDEVKEFTDVIHLLFHSRDPAVLNKAKDLAKTEAVQKYFNDFKLFEECFQHFDGFVAFDDSYLSAFRILLECKALDISEVNPPQFYRAVAMLPDDVATLMFQKLEPTDKFLQSMLDSFSQVSNYILMNASKYMIWSYGKVSNKVWVPLLEIVIPTYPDRRVPFLKNLLPVLLRDIGGLKEKIRYANAKGLKRASQFLIPIVSAFTFFVGTSDTNLNDSWLPDVVLAKLVEFLRADMLTIPEWTIPILPLV